MLDSCTAPTHIRLHAGGWDQELLWQGHRKGVAASGPRRDSQAVAQPGPGLAKAAHGRSDRSGKHLLLLLTLWGVPHCQWLTSVAWPLQAWGLHQVLLQLQLAPSNLEVQNEMRVVLPSQPEGEPSYTLVSGHWKPFAALELQAWLAGASKADSTLPVLYLLGRSVPDCSAL